MGLDISSIINVKIRFLVLSIWGNGVVVSASVSALVIVSAICIAKPHSDRCR